MKKHYDTIVVGGGIIGNSIAYSLLKRGQSVLVIEKGEINRKASSAAAGMLAAQAEVTEAGPLFDLARKSRNMFPSLNEELMERTGVDIELIQKGMLTTAYTNDKVQELKEVIDFQRSLGEEAVWLTREDIQQVEPNLSEKVIGGMYAPRDGQVSAFKLASGFARGASALGGDYLEFTDVHGLLIEEGRVRGVQALQGEFYSENVVIAGGAWSTFLLKQLDVNLGMYPVKGECFSVITALPLITKTIFAEDCYIVPKREGRILVGATMVPHTFDEKVTADGVSWLLERAISILPALKEAEWERAWAGIRPQTTDGLPYLGVHPTISGLFVATGHYRNGVLLSPITGEVIADMIEQKELPFAMQAFSLDLQTRRGLYEASN
ncbi:glycine oxidase ThiO [Bacillus pinisoli]|uniref:glycine oxidase ThiO n=1 Tax=Bacillus pinisoli TaxID=2901866 RepID=UPI001FF5A4F6